jgi:hypothetical protein
MFAKLGVAKRIRNRRPKKAQTIKIGIRGLNVTAVGMVDEIPAANTRKQSSLLLSS